MSKILLVEDDKGISEMIKDYLVCDSFEVIQAFDGQEAINQFAAGGVDLILLDLMIPKVDGLQVIKKIREADTVPILVVSAKDGESDKALALGLGADDYIQKPFSLVELTARIKANIRRVTKYVSKQEVVETESVIKIYDLEINLDTYSVQRAGEEIKLTGKEFEILKLFALHPNRVYTKAQLYELVWQEEYYGDDNVINVHIRRLREKIEVDTSKPRYIKTLWGIGYKMEADK